MPRQVKQKLKQVRPVRLPLQVTLRQARQILRPAKLTLRNQKPMRLQAQLTQRPVKLMPRLPLLLRRLLQLTLRQARLKPRDTRSRLTALLQLSMKQQKQQGSIKKQLRGQKQMPRQVKIRHYYTKIALLSVNRQAKQVKPVLRLMPTTQVQVLPARPQAPVKRAKVKPPLLLQRVKPKLLKLMPKPVRLTLQRASQKRKSTQNKPRKYQKVLAEH